MTTIQFSTLFFGYLFLLQSINAIENVLYEDCEASAKVLHQGSTKVLHSTDSYNITWIPSDRSCHLFLDFLTIRSFSIIMDYDGSSSVFCRPNMEWWMCHPNAFKMCPVAAYYLSKYSTSNTGLIDSKYNFTFLSSDYLKLYYCGDYGMTTRVNIFVYGSSLEFTWHLNSMAIIVTVGVIITILILLSIIVGVCICVRNRRNRQNQVQQPLMKTTGTIGGSSNIGYQATHASN